MCSWYPEEQTPSKQELRNAIGFIPTFPPHGCETMQTKQSRDYLYGTLQHIGYWRSSEPCSSSYKPVINTIRQVARIIFPPAELGSIKRRRKKSKSKTDLRWISDTIIWSPVLSSCGAKGGNQIQFPDRQAQNVSVQMALAGFGTVSRLTVLGGVNHNKQTSGVLRFFRRVFLRFST